MAQHSSTRTNFGFGAGEQRKRSFWGNAPLPRSPSNTELHHAILLREGDHRIKNSLQIVVGLIRAQARRADNALVRDALLTASARIQAIARMHDALQVSSGDDVIDIGAVVEITCQSLQDMAGDICTVSIQINAESILVPIALARPIVLTVTELVLNALRHAFPDGRVGTINVSMAQSGGRLRLVVADNGVGLPAHYADGAGYGMKLVNMIVAEIGGTLSAETGVGAHITMTANVNPNRGLAMKASPEGY
ncbi:MAG: sensor histidine kinase [Pseudomonadota bacterium]